jgi:hypothetical protein
MDRNALGVAVLTALLAWLPACSSTSALAPSTSSPSLSAPVAQSPVNNVTTTSLTPTLVVSGGGLTTGSGPVQYRFRVVDPVGTTAADSGLLGSTTWTPSAPLTPTTKYTWMARSEYQGWSGPWSTAAIFTTPVAPGNDYGAWETSCQGKLTSDLVSCVWNFIRPTNSVQDLEVVKRVAWLLRNQGGGLLLKGSGDNTVPWLGQTFSASRVCFPANGHLFKILSDAGPGGGNGPQWVDNDFVDPASCVPAIDPRLR